MSASFAAEVRCAVAAVAQACRLTDNVQRIMAAAASSNTTTTSPTLDNLMLAKSDASPVTIADFGAQCIINRHLLAAFPDDAVVAEEDSAELRAGGAAMLADVVANVNAVLSSTSSSSSSSSSSLTADEVCAAIDHGDSLNDGGGKGRIWTIDPIDGTKGFLRIAQYAVCLGLLVDGMPTVGVLGCPSE
jgi:3'(2'), 5'-bisphosphate nucleotidase